MKLITNIRPASQGFPAEDPIRYFNLERFENTSKDCYLFLGRSYDSMKDPKFNDKKKIIICFEEPNFCTVGSDHVDTFNNYADEILTICPYTAMAAPKRTAIFFPFNDEFIPTSFEKEFDIIYSGGLHHATLKSFIEGMREFNYRFLSYSDYPHVTNIGTTYAEKINLYSKSKITLVHNILHPHRHDIPRYKAFPYAANNPAFKLIDQGLMPQLKSRTFEAAFTKSLILCFKDQWNVIENYFESDKDFIYFDNIDDLKIKTKHILENYEQYTHIIENAFNKAINNYTTKHFIEKYIGPKS